MPLPDAGSNLKRLYTRKSLLQVAIQVEKFLDSMNVFVYPNWFDGELVDGPRLSRYWVAVTLKYDFKNMPDPQVARILAKVGVRTKFTQDKELVGVKIREPEDIRPGTVAKPKMKEHKVWLIELNIPRRFIDEEHLNDLENIDYDMDVDDVADALDNTKQSGDE